MTCRPTGLNSPWTERDFKTHSRATIEMPPLPDLAQLAIEQLHLLTQFVALLADFNLLGEL